MKKLLIIFYALLLVTIHSNAQSAMVQKVGKTVFSLTTYKEDGSILATSHGVYTGGTCEGISSFTPFIGASSAVVMDAAGRKYEVESIIGANEMYDICRFNISGGVAPVEVAQKTATGKVFAVGFSVNRPKATPLTIKSSEKFMDKYNYYVFNEEVTDEIEGCPIANANGEIIGIVQRSKTNYDAHSTDIRYYSELESSGFAMRDPVLNKTKIRAALPVDKEQARLMLMMIDASYDSLAVVNTVKEYNNKYPGEIDGYTTLSNYLVNHDDIDQASRVMRDAINQATSKEEAYFEYARQIYNVAIFIPDSIQNPWTLDLAEENINKALAINPRSTYKHQLGQILYSKGDYQKAYDLFEEITNVDMAHSDVFFEMAQCKSHLGASSSDILPYLDKCIEACPQPLTQVSAPYYFTRGVTLDAMGEYKKALQDYNVYDTLMYFRAAPEFYYTRYKCNTQLRHYQQALNDIAHAAVIAPYEITYLAELAALDLRLGMYEDAVKTCEISFKVTTDSSDIYIIQGAAYMKLEKNEEAKAAFLKAKELGDDRADSYLEKLK